MPFNANPPQLKTVGGLRHGTKPWPYNPNPEKASKWAELNYTTTQAQADQYSWLANKFLDILSSGNVPGAAYWSGPRLYDRMRRERLLPAFGKDITPSVVKRVQTFGRRTLNLKNLKLSVHGLEQILIGGSE